MGIHGSGVLVLFTGVESGVVRGMFVSGIVVEHTAFVSDTEMPMVSVSRTVWDRDTDS